MSSPNDSCDEPLRLALGWRPIPARRGLEHVVTHLLRERGHAVTQVEDSPLELDAFDVVLLLENCRWFPAIMRQFSTRRPTVRRPLLAVWHWEPLPLPAAAGVPRPSLSAREVAKIVFRDRRATDPYSNLSALRRLHSRGWPDLLAVSSQAWRESLAERGIAAHWVPYGYEPTDGAPIDGQRDIEALFLGALSVPRRRRIIKQLRRSGVPVQAKGSWDDKACWGEDRRRLMNRADAFLNIQRFAGEVSASRLILGMANKALVVSEPIYGPAPFVPGEHYVEAESREFPEVLSYYRTHRAERDRIVEQAHRLVTEELTMRRSISRLLSLLNGTR